MAKKLKSKKPVRVVRRAVLKSAPAKKKDNTKLIVGAGVAVLVLAGIGYYFYSRQQGAEEVPLNAPPEGVKAPPKAVQKALRTQQKIQEAMADRSAITGRQPLSAERQQALSAAVSNPTVYYADGTTATVSKAEAEQLVASGQFRWGNAPKTSVVEGASSGQATTMSRRR